MKLLPHLGVDAVRFGDSASNCVVAIGEPTERRVHPPEQRISLYYPSLTLGFTSDDRLDFVAVHDAGRAGLWGERPFEIAQRASDPYSAVKQWVESLGRVAQPHQDCFGAEIRVEDEGVTFCFELPDRTHLQGIQLSPG